MRPVLPRRDLVGLACILAAVGAMLLFRAWYVEPRVWASVCVLPGSIPELPRPVPPQAPFACTPRAILLWMQHYQIWGVAALVLGLMAFIGRMPFWVVPAAVAAGVVAVINYNATWGMAAAALGTWGWITDRRFQRG